MADAQPTHSMFFVRQLGPLHRHGSQSGTSGVTSRKGVWRECHVDMQRCRLASDNKHGQRDLFVDVLVNNTAGSLLQMLVPPQSSCGGYVPAVLAPDPLAVMLADAGALAVLCEQSLLRRLCCRKARRASVATNCFEESGSVQKR